MEIIIPHNNTLTFQFISLYDRTIFHFVERVTQHLRESIYILKDERLNGIGESLTLGDIIPEKYLSTKSNWYIYQLDQYQDLEDIIQQLNQDLYGTNLTDIPEVDVVVKFVLWTQP
jgi:hypothetical protein